MKRVAFVLWANDQKYWKTHKEMLEEDGWTVVFFPVSGRPDWIPITRFAPVPEQVAEFDIVMVYGIGVQNWFVSRLNELNKPTLYCSSVGIPSFLDVDNYQVLEIPASLEAIEKALERLVE